MSMTSLGGKNVCRNREAHSNNLSEFGPEFFFADIRLQEKQKKRTRTAVMEDSFTAEDADDMDVAFPEAAPAGQQQEDVPVDFVPWYDDLATLPPIEETTRKKPAPKAGSVKNLEEILQKAKALYEEEAAEYAKTAPKTNEQKWLRTVMKSGTSADRSAAMTLAVQQSPFHGLKTLDILLTLAKKKGRRECVMACETLKDLFVTNILPDRKLLFFRQQEYTHPSATSKHLKHWYFEHEIKERYTQFIQALEVGTKDTVSHHREQMIHYLFDLLVTKPEQEKVILALIINKLGDPEKRISSKIVHLLGQLLQKHPNMRGVVVNEVEVFLHRPHLSARAQYCSIIFLNQIILDKTQVPVAQKLIAIYFTLFKQYVEREEVESKMLSALLTGVSRAIPFAKVNNAMFREHIDTLFRLVHVTSFSKSVQALLLLLQIFTHTAPLEETTEANIAEVTEMARMESRFYRALYAKIFSPDLFQSSKQPVLLNVLFKALKVDSCMPRVIAVVKRLLQVCTYQRPPFVCGALFMVSELTKAQPALASYIQHIEDHDEENFISEKWAKKLQEIIDKEAEERKKVQAAESRSADKKEEKHTAEDTAGGGGDGEESDDEDEDLPKNLSLDKEDSESEDKEEEEEENEAGNKQKSKQNGQLKEEGNKKSVDGAWNTFYDPNKREPEFSNAEKTMLWELRQLGEHYHPSVAKFSQMLLRGEHIVYDGNPLQDMTLMAFLERFSFRNPKKSMSDKGGSLMQPTTIPRWKTQEPVNKASFLGMPEYKIREDEVFFYRFFKQRSLQRKLKEAPADSTADKSKKKEKEKPYFLEKQELGVEGGRPDEEDFVAKVKEKVNEDGSVDFEGGYDYDDLANISDSGEEDEDDWDLEGKDDKFYEDLLRQELEDEDEALEDEVREGGEDFASVEEFAHLLEQSGQDYAGIHKKQLAWELKGDNGRDDDFGRGGGDGDEGDEDKIDLEAFGDVPEGKTSKKGARKRRREEDSAARKELGIGKKKGGKGQGKGSKKGGKGKGKPSATKRRRK